LNAIGNVDFIDADAKLASADTGKPMTDDRKPALINIWQKIYIILMPLVMLSLQHWDFARTPIVYPRP